MTALLAGDVEVARYVTEPDVDIRLGPRPYLHPIRTLGGIVVTDAFCEDHPWHMGASLTIADVNGLNFWGGKTYRADTGYAWRDDHGRVRHDAFTSSGAGAFTESLRWESVDGTTVVRERRTVSAALAPYGWELTFRYALTAPASHEVVLGSPATHGRPGGAGYGGFFWRLAPGVVSSSSPNGSAEPSMTLTADDAYTLVFRGLENGDRWFVRTEEYPGVCAALAYEKELTIPAGETLRREIRVLVADGVPPISRLP